MQLGVRAQGDARADRREHALDLRELRRSRLLAAVGARRHLVPRPLEHLEIGEQQLGVDDLDVAPGIDPARDMGDVLVAKAANDVRYGVDSPDGAEKTVAETFTFGGSLDQTGHVEKLDAGRDRLRFAEDAPDLGQARVGHRHDRVVGVDGAEGIVLHRRLCAREGVEDRRLAHVRQADDAAGKTHRVELPRP